MKWIVKEVKPQTGEAKVESIYGGKEYRIWHYKTLAEGEVIEGELKPCLYSFEPADS